MLRRMQTPIQVTFEHMPRSDALEARIRAGVEKLELFQPRLTSCRVVVEQLDHHRQQGRQFRVKVEARAPGHEAGISTLHHHEDAFVAVRDAFDSARRQLEDAVRKAR
jgi:ribosome-associated translation inhibitor RaiA